MKCGFPSKFHQKSVHSRRSTYNRQIVSETTIKHETTEKYSIIYLFFTNNHNLLFEKKTNCKNNQKLKLRQEIENTNNRGYFIFLLALIPSPS